MALSKKTTEQVDVYIKRLVKTQPNWLRKLFDEERIYFSFEDDHSFQLAIDVKLDEEVKDHAQGLIHGYIKKHPAKFFASRDIFH